MPPTYVRLFLPAKVECTTPVKKSTHIGYRAGTEVPIAGRQDYAPGPLHPDNQIGGA